MGVVFRGPVLKWVMFCQVCMSTTILDGVCLKLFSFFFVAWAVMYSDPQNIIRVLTDPLCDVG